MQWQFEQAIQTGTSSKEVPEAIEVAIEMGGGPAAFSARFALEMRAGAGLKPAR